MNFCTEWEDLLLRYQELDPVERDLIDRHLTRCPECRLFLETIEEIDVDLATALTGVEPAPGFQTRVMARRSGPQRLPAPWISEVLDGIGWLSLLGLATTLISYFAPGWLTARLPPAWPELEMLNRAGVILMLAAVAYGVRSWSGLRS